MPLRPARQPLTASEMESESWDGLHNRAPLPGDTGRGEQCPGDPAQTIPYGAAHTSSLDDLGQGSCRENGTASITAHGPRFKCAGPRTVPDLCRASRKIENTVGVYACVTSKMRGKEDMHEMKSRDNIATLHFYIAGFSL